MPCSTARGVAYATCVYDTGTGIPTTGVGSNRFIRRMYTINRNEGEEVMATNDTMQVRIARDHTIVIPTSADLINECKVGSGADTCIYLVGGADGITCEYNGKLKQILEDRRATSVAQRKGCERVIDWHKKQDPRTLHSYKHIGEIFEIP